MVTPEDSDINTTLIIWNKPLGFDERTAAGVDCVLSECFKIMAEQPTIACMEFKRCMVVSELHKAHRYRPWVMPVGPAHKPPFKADFWCMAHAYPLQFIVAMQLSAVQKRTPHYVIIWVEGLPSSVLMVPLVKMATFKKEKKVVASFPSQEL